MDGLKKTMELEAAFDSQAQSAALKKNNTTVQFTMQKLEYKGNESSRILKGSAPTLLTGTPMLSLRAVAEAYGGTVTWVPENKTVVVSFQKADALPALTAPKVDPVDGFQVVTIGTSGPPLSPTSTWSSTLVQYQDKLFLVGCCGGATYGLLDAGIAPSLVKNLLFTHHHADHDTDYFTFAIGGWNGPTGRRALNLVGPAGTTELHEIMMDYYKEDLQYRIQYSFPPEGIAKNVFIKELNGPETFDLDGVSISTAEMTHTIKTFAYRFDAGVKRLILTHLPPSGLKQAEVEAYFKASGFKGTVIVGENLGKYTVK